VSFEVGNQALHACNPHSAIIALQHPDTALVWLGSKPEITASQHWHPLHPSEQTLRERSRTTLRGSIHEFARFRFCPEGIQVFGSTIAKAWRCRALNSFSASTASRVNTSGGLKILGGIQSTGCSVAFAPCGSMGETPTLRQNFDAKESHRIPDGSRTRPPRRVQAKSEGSFTAGLAASFITTGCSVAGNCNTVACWPSISRVSSTTCPSGNSNAS
jgi:hypothetical protein